MVERKLMYWYQSSIDDGVKWSTAVQVTTAQSDETVSGASSDQYGDYNGLSGHAGEFSPSGTSGGSSAREEIWTARIIP